MVIQYAIMGVIILLIIILYSLGQKLSDELRSIGMIVCVLGACGVAGWIYTTFVHKANIREANQQCLTRIKELTDAVQKYNDSHVHMMDTKLDIRKLAKNNLVTTNFFPEEDKKEFECTYSAQGDLAGSGQVKCSVHGTASDIKMTIEKNK